MAEAGYGFAPRDIRRISRAVRASERNAREPVGGQSITRRPQGGKGGEFGVAKLVEDLRDSHRARAQPATGINPGNREEFLFDAEPDNEIRIESFKALGGLKIRTGTIVYYRVLFGVNVLDLSHRCPEPV